MRQGHTTDAGPRLGTQGKYLCLELLAVFTPAWAVLIQRLFHRLHDPPSWGRCPLHAGSSRWDRRALTFIGRQRRLRIDQTWYRVDLLLFHRRLRCLVIIDLKLGSLTHADVGQMHMYCNYAKEHWAYSDENPPVGLILCADKGHALARYALEGLPTKVMAANYRTVLPDAELLQKELEATRRLLESRTSNQPKKLPR